MGSLYRRISFCSLLLRSILSKTCFVCAFVRLFLQSGAKAVIYEFSLINHLYYLSKTMVEPTYQFVFFTFEIYSFQNLFCLIVCAFVSLIRCKSGHLWVFLDKSPVLFIKDNGRTDVSVCVLYFWDLFFPKLVLFDCLCVCFFNQVQKWSFMSFPW